MCGYMKWQRGLERCGRHGDVQCISDGCLTTIPMATLTRPAMYGTATCISTWLTDVYVCMCVWIVQYPMFVYFVSCFYIYTYITRIIVHAQQHTYSCTHTFKDTHVFGRTIKQSAAMPQDYSPTSRTLSGDPMPSIGQHTSAFADAVVIGL